MKDRARENEQILRILDVPMLEARRIMCEEGGKGPSVERRDKNQTQVCAHGE